MTAHERAEQLLEEYLTPAQRRSYRDTGHFVVKGSRGGRYRITASGRGLVHVLHPRGPKFNYVRQAYLRPCSYPVADQQLSLKLLIETDEPGFLSLSCNRYAERADYLAVGLTP